MPTAWERKSKSAAWILSVAICVTFFLPATRRVFSYLREIRVERHLRTRGVCAAGWHKVRESAVFRRNRLLDARERLCRKDLRPSRGQHCALLRGAEELSQ